MSETPSEKTAVSQSKDDSSVAAPDSDESLQEYRAHLVAAGQKTLEEYDKAVMTLSGVAFAASVAFVKDIAGPGTITNKNLLVTAWLCWGLSVASVLCSLFMSYVAVRGAINQIDQGLIYDQRPGGVYAKITNVLNVTGGVLFLVGMMFLIYFVLRNIER